MSGRQEPSTGWSGTEQIRQGWCWQGGEGKPWEKVASQTSRARSVSCLEVGEAGRQGLGLKSLEAAFLGAAFSSPRGLRRKSRERTASQRFSLPVPTLPVFCPSL